MKARRTGEEMESLAKGDYDAIPWLDLHYDDWLWLQHFWQRESLGLKEGEPLAVALEALDRITRLALNSRGSDSYWIARMALAKLGLWPHGVTEDRKVASLSSLSPSRGRLGFAPEEDSG